MKILENNLKQFINVPENIYELVNNYITEVDSFNYPFAINNLVVGKVLDVKKHENADTLFVTQVDLGTEVKQIVCGADNVKAGQSVIVATEGAVLPGDFKIKKSAIRGVESNGMICSLRELGIKDELVSEEFQKGIFYFSKDLKPGTNPLKELLLEGFVMELDLTPNRNDLLSHYGFAQDLAAVLNEKIRLPKITYNHSSEKNPLTVKIESKNTNSYYAKYFDNVRVEPSPLWLQLFLEKSGVKPINNIVDITNYILFTYGIPMHAFDALKFNSKEIVVKDNNKAQKVITLDEQEISLTKGEILITNGQEIMALGGIMGLDNSKIDNETTSVILEVASFSKERTRESSKNLNLKSDSSLRFERGIDETIMMQALDHASYLIKELSLATVYEGIAGEVKANFENNLIEIDIERIVKLVGENIEKTTIIDILKRLNYEVEDLDKKLIVKAPSYRHDIAIFYDVLEEIIRIHGMDKIALKPMISTNSKGLSNKQKDIRNLRIYLSNFGLNEVVNYSLRPLENIDFYNKAGEVVTVLKPMSQDRLALRQSLINGLLETKQYNLNHNNREVNIFEIGNIYTNNLEDKMVAVLLSTSNYKNPWKKTNNEIDFYYASGLLENIMKLLNVKYHLEKSDHLEFHPHQQAHIIVNKEVVGIIGKIHPKNIKEDTYIIEFNYDKLVKYEEFDYEVISKYPTVERDIAFIIKDDIPVSNIIEKITQTIRKNLVKVELFDVYKGSHVAENHQSLAFKLTLNDKSQTLNTEDINKLVNRVVKRLEHEYNIELRK